MKKILFLLIIISCSVNAQEITKEFLSKHKFEDSRHWGAYAKIIFTDDGHYTLDFNSIGPKYKDKGIYTISNNIIYLNPSKCIDQNALKNDTSINCDSSLGKGTCYIVNADSDLYAAKFLVFHPMVKDVNRAYHLERDSIYFMTDGFELKEGTARVFHGMDVISMGLKNATTIDNVKIREKPSAESKELEYRTAIYWEEPKYFVPANTDLIVLARTVNKEKVGKWENYWYLVDLGYMKGVWMFGEFIKFKN